MEVIRDIDNSDVQPCVATIGFFDGVHRGHRFLIEQVKRVAAEEGLRSALITFPIHPRKVMQKDYQPLLLSTTKEKAELLASTEADYCVMLDFTPQLAKLSAKEFMEDVLKERLNVRTLVIGYDHRFGHNRSEGFEDYCRYGEEIGIKVVRAEACVIDGINVSSSVIRHLLQNGEMEKANKCLGYEYYLDGTVVDGYKVGRTIGFPTANLKVENPDKLVPADGVYAVKVTVAGQEHYGMLSIGVRPTMNNGANRSIEVNIFDFSSNIYDKFIRITFVKYTRPELKFDSLDALIEGLRQDEKTIREIFKNYTNKN